MNHDHFKPHFTEQGSGGYDASPSKKEQEWIDKGKAALAEMPIATTLVIGRKSKYDTKGTYPVSLDGTTVGHVVAVENGYTFYRGMGKTATRIGVSITTRRTMKELKEAILQCVR